MPKALGAKKRIPAKKQGFVDNLVFSLEAEHFHFGTYR